MKLTLVSDARSAWKWASVQLAIVAGAAAGWAAADPTGFATVVNFLPGWVRPLLGFVVAGAAIGSRIVKKDKSNG
jgi:hypothetical protein